jgi:hypothetical protein
MSSTSIILSNTLSIEIPLLIRPHVAYCVDEVGVNFFFVIADSCKWVSDCAD